MKDGLYYSAVVNEEALRTRFDVMPIDGEGILIDREGGGVYRLNRTACEIWSAVMAGHSVPEISASIASHFGIARERATRDVRMALMELPSPSAGSSTQQEPAGYLWQATPGGYALVDQDTTICEIARDGSQLCLPPGAPTSYVDAWRAIRSVVTRVLALRGVYVLHASAVAIDGIATVFTGLSGAGKTTTARAFARVGADIVSEDLLVLAPPPAIGSVIIDGEKRIRSWLTEATERAVKLHHEPIRCDGLDRIAKGKTLPIDTILLLDVARRAGDRIEVEPLSRTSALIELIKSLFFASADASDWLAQLDFLKTLVTGAVTSTSTMPLGVATLDSAVQRFRQRHITAS
jgi:hypothetical protein